MVTMMGIIDITDILMQKELTKELNENQQQVLDKLALAYGAAKSAANYPEGRDNYFRHCRTHLEKALIYLNEEIDGEQPDS